MADNLEDSTYIDYCWFEILAESHLSVAREGEVPAQEMEVQLDYRNDINKNNHKRAVLKPVILMSRGEISAAAIFYRKVDFADSKISDQVLLLNVAAVSETECRECTSDCKCGRRASRK